MDYVWQSYTRISRQGDLGDMELFWEKKVASQSESWGASHGMGFIPPMGLRWTMIFCDEWYGMGHDARWVSLYWLQVAVFSLVFLFLIKYMVFLLSQSHEPKPLT